VTNEGQWEPRPTKVGILIPAKEIRACRHLGDSQIS
jgi:hypothetical protein